MRHLSDSTVREIIILSEARLAAIPQNQTNEEILESILGEPSPQQKALQDSLDKLSHDQALDLVAMMYTGRTMVESEPNKNDPDVDEGLDGQLPKEKFGDFYKDHQRNFQNNDTATLISICEEKSNALPRYLRAALEHRSQTELKSAPKQDLDKKAQKKQAVNTRHKPRATAQSKPGHGQRLKFSLPTATGE